MRLLRQRRLFNGGSGRDHENKIINCGRLGLPHLLPYISRCLHACRRKQTNRKEAVIGADERQSLCYLMESRKFVVRNRSFARETVYLPNKFARKRLLLYYPRYFRVAIDTVAQPANDTIFFYRCTPYDCYCYPVPLEIVTISKFTSEV